MEREYNKDFILESNGTWFACEPVLGEVTQPVDDLPGCTNRISHVTYRTVTRCEKRRLSKGETPNFTPESTHCDYYVDPQTVGGTGMASRSRANKEI